MKKARYEVRNGVLVEVPLPASDFSALEAAVKPVAPKVEPLVDSAGHPIGNYL